MTNCIHCGELLLSTAHQCTPAVSGSTDASLTPLGCEQWYAHPFDFADPWLRKTFAATERWRKTQQRDDVRHQGGEIGIAWKDDVMRIDTVLLGLCE